MKSKSDLTKKVLCSLLAASTMGIFYSGDAHAAKINGENVGTTITNETIFDMEDPSSKIVIGQGEVSIQAGADIPTIISRFQEKYIDDSDLISALRYALMPVNGGQTPFVGLVGGEMKLTGQLLNTLESLAQQDNDKNLKAIADRILAANTASGNEYSGDVSVTIGNETVDPVVIGYVGGDILAKLGNSEGYDAKGEIVPLTFNRTGNVNNVINGGNVLLGVGGSSVITFLDELDSITSITLKGNVDTNVSGNTNIGIFANGGLALNWMGNGKATSVLDGKTNLVINTTSEKSKIDALSVAVAGGGAALSLSGVDTESRVTGTTNVTISGNGTAAIIAGSGVAIAENSDPISANASTGKSTVIIDLKGETDGTVLQQGVGKILQEAAKIDIDKDDFGLSAITFDNLNSALKQIAGQSAAIGITGGGVAVGTSAKDVEASVTTAGTDIYLNDGYVVGTFGTGIALATGFSNASVEMTDTVNINVGNGITQAIGVFGNGFAYFTGEDGEANGYNGVASATAVNTNMNIAGTSDGVYGGGLAFDDTNANYTNAKVETSGTATINVYDGAEVKPLNFDGFNFISGDDSATGLGLKEYITGVRNAAEDIAIAGGGVAVGGGAESTVNNAEVNVYGGKVNGSVVAGGIAAYGYKENDADNNKGAHVNTSTLNLYGGEITGNVYAGGSANIVDEASTFKDYTNAYATVGNATINLAGTEVTGVLTGKGVSGTEHDTAVTSTLNLIGENTLTLVTSSGEGDGKEESSKFNGFTNFNATADSVTKVEGLNATTALIDATNTNVSIDSSAKLDINALDASDEGNTYSVVSSANEASTFWTDGNLLYDRTVNYAYGTGNDENDKNNYNIVYKTLANLTEEEQQAAVEAFTDSLGTGGEALTGVANAIITNKDKVAAEAPGAKEFFSDFTSANGTNRDLKAMALIGEAAGVTSNTISVAGDMADNSVLRLSFTQDDVTGEPKVNEDGAVWAKYIHNKHDLDGMASSLGSIDSSSDFDGVTVGVDFAKEGKIQSGIAFSYGDGDSHGSGINNDFDMWGLTLYGNIKTDDANVIGDIGFSKSDNELTGSAMGKHVKADRNVGVFTVGVRAEKLYTNGSTQIVPYTGLRYYNVDPDSYTAYYNGQKFGEFEAERQDIVTLPLGVSLRSETITESGWRIVPQADIAYVWAFGDTDSEVELNVAGGVSTLGYTVMDSGSWLGSLGVAAGKDDWTFGVGYSYQKGSHAEANRWYVDVEYSF